jgi:ELWxxDGT repeat protein
MKKAIIAILALAIGVSGGLFLLTSCGSGGGGGDAELLFFAGDDTASGNWELWSYDGVSAPNKVAELRSGSAGSSPFLFTPFNGDVYFSANGDEGGELYATDGSSAWVVTDLNPGSNPSNAQSLIVHGGSLYFRTSTPPALWKTDGTAPGTEEIAGPSHTFNFTGIGELAPYGSDLVFTGVSSRGIGLYKTNGSAAGTTVLDVGFDVVGDVAAFGDTILFGAGQGGSGLELWASDGTAGAATFVKEIETGGTGSNPHTMIALDNKVVFEAFRTAEGSELWESDGTASGTTLVADFYSGSEDSLVFDEMHLHDGRVYFTAKESDTEAETWYYDGSSSPQRLADINPGPDGSWGTYYQSVNGLLYISAYHPSYDNEMWVSNGTAVGTTLAFDLAPAGSGVLGD